MGSVPLGHDRREAVLMRWNNATKYYPKSGQRDGFWMRISKAALTPRHGGHFSRMDVGQHFNGKTNAKEMATLARLKAGFMVKNQFYPTKQGTPQGGIASPTLANMVLDGLEQRVRNCSAFKDHGKGRKSTVDRINLVRYCDDFIVTAKSREVLEEKVKPAVESFLKERGLSFSKEKTRILSIEEGFGFLGQNVRKYNGTLLIKPAKKNVQALKDKLKVIFAKMKAAPAWALIRTLNPILKGWAYYHRHIVAKKTFSDIDHFVFDKMVRWMKRKHPRHGGRISHGDGRCVSTFLPLTGGNFMIPTERAKQFACFMLNQWSSNGT